MRKLVFTLSLSLILLLAMAFVPVAAQDTECTADAIEDQIDTFYATYLMERDEDITVAAQALADSITELLTECESVSDTEDTTATDSVVIPGRWFVNWSTDGTTCPDGTTSTATDRPFLLTLSDEGFIATDNYAWPPLEFMPTDDEMVYSFDRNDPSGNFTYRYDVTILSNEEMSGTITLFYVSGCTLENSFVMVLQDADVICMVNSDSGANLRSGPGTDFSRAGQLPAIHLQSVIGQTTGSDGFVWWQLEDDSWVRSDVVEEVGDCESVEEAE